MDVSSLVDTEEKEEQLTVKESTAQAGSVRLVCYTAVVRAVPGLFLFLLFFFILFLAVLLSAVSPMITERETSSAVLLS